MSTLTKSARGRHNWRLIFSIVFTLVFTYLALSGIDFDNVWDTLRTINQGLLGLAFIFAIASLIAKAGRWRYLYSPHNQNISFYRAFSILMIGLLANAYLPIRIGELIRAFLMGEIDENGKTYALGTIFLEKLLDLTLITLVLTIFITQLALPYWLEKSWQTIAPITIGFIVIVCLMVWQKNSVSRLTQRISLWFSPKYRDRLIRIVNQGMSSLQFIEQPRRVVGVIAWSMLVWWTSAASIFLIFQSMHLQLNFWIAWFVMVVLQAGVALPTPPGNLGVFHYITILALSIFGVSKEVGLSAGIVLHLMVYLPITLIGLYCFWHENLAWKTIINSVTRLFQPQ